VGVPAVFFFSRRRRHTRSKRDWSSDVCSSDLRISKSYHTLIRIKARPPSKFKSTFTPLIGKSAFLLVFPLISFFFQLKIGIHNSSTDFMVYRMLTSGLAQIWNDNCKRYVWFVIGRI